jgi:adenine-specific DNA-methyltransferase
MQGNNYQIDKEPILEIPILNSSNVQAQDQIVQCVDQLLQLNKELYIATLETKREQIKQKIDYNEDKINALVYELYELTAEEINLIENS